MKKQSHNSLRFVVVAGLAACATVLAQGTGDAGKGYGRFDVGVNLLNDVDIDELEGLDISDVGGKIEAEFDPGVRFGVAGGYNFSDSFAAELEVGFAYNSMDALRVSGGGVDEEVELSDTGVDMNLYQVPMMVNLSYTIPLKSRFKPFIGGGVGGVLAILDASADGYSASETAFAFAYQGFAGVNYRLSESVDLGVIYKYMGSTDLSFDSIETGGIGQHMIGLNLVWRF